MANSRKVLEQIQTLRDLRGTKEKQDFLKDALEEELFRQVITWALDPMITFGIRDTDFMQETLDARERMDERRGRELSADDYKASSFYRNLEKMRERRLTGNTAKTAIKGMLMDYTFETSVLLMMIIEKDIRAGVGISTVNKARPGTLFEFNVMLASKFEPEKISYPVYVEPKYDGMRLLAITDADSSDFYTRTGKAVTTVGLDTQLALQDLFAQGTDIWRPKNKMVFDGELMGESFKETMEQARRKDGSFDKGVFYVFDAMPLEDFKKLKQKKRPMVSYEARRKALADVYRYVKGQAGIELPPSYYCRNEAEVMHFYQSVRDRGLEGLIIKNPTGLYHPRRNRDWMKIKDAQTVDVPIVHAIEGTGKYEGMLGALVVDCEGVEVNIGTGFSDADRMTLWESFNNGWLTDRLIEVEYHEKTPDGSLRHPRFKRFRDDKRKEDGIGC